VAIFCVSIHHGNTLKIARTISEVLSAEILKPEDMDPADAVKRYDLIGLGSGIYYGRPHKLLLEFAERLPRASGKPVFIFSTSGLPKVPLLHDYHKPLIGVLRKRGFRIIGEFTCRGYNTHGILRSLGGMNKGRPSHADLEKAKRFAEEVFSLLEQEKPRKSV